MKLRSTEQNWVFIFPSSSECSGVMEFWADFDSFTELEWDWLQAQVAERCRLRVSECPSCKTKISGAIPRRCQCGFDFNLLRPAKKPGRRARVAKGLAE